MLIPSTAQRQDANPQSPAAQVLAWTVSEIVYEPRVGIVKVECHRSGRPISVFPHDHLRHPFCGLPALIRLNSVFLRPI